METAKNGFLAAVFSALLRPIVRRLDRPSLAKHHGQISLTGLDDKVKVTWDPYGIPHVFASGEQDLFLAQGYLHAQERLWQMDMSRRFLSGRLAEIFGDFSLPWKEISGQFRGRSSADFDYFMRLMGIRHSAEACARLLSEGDRLRLEAYSTGINRYIEQCGRKLPWEFRVLRYEPGPWRPEDSLTIAKGLAFLLTTALITRLNHIAIAARLKDQPEKIRALLPSYPNDRPTITSAVWNQVRGLWEFMNGTLAGSDWQAAGLGSNNWVVAPSRSATGSAILCNDPHLRMTLPSIWYLMHLKAESISSQPDGYEVWGASIPGFPCIQLGHNRWIAWGITAALCDDVELYREQRHPLDSDRYQVGHQWQKFEVRQELIVIRGNRTLQRTVRSTRHGPVISDFAADSGAKEILSLRWTAHDASQELSYRYGVNCAHDWPEFLASLSHQTAPTLNYVYADRQGNIGYTLAGKIPIRPEVPSLLPVEGWRKSNDWRGYLPFDQMPRVYNPPEGVIATANNAITDASYPHYLSHFFEPPYRICRINQRLAAQRRFSVKDLSEIQMDRLSLHAIELIAVLKSDLDQMPEGNLTIKAAADRLLGWDGRCHEKSVESAIFHVFHHRLMANLLTPALGNELFYAYVESLNQCIVPTDLILRDSNSPWFALRTRPELVLTSLREACAEIELAIGANMAQWHWGKIHRLTLNHSLGRFRLLRPMLNIGPFPSGGDCVTVNMGFYRHANPYGHTVGAALRFIVDLGHWQNSGFILPSGQSGHPFSRHYRDQTEFWRNGERLGMSFSGDEIDFDRNLVLEPSP